MVDTWQDAYSQTIEKTPSKSAFSQFRKGVSFTFCKDIFESQVVDFKPHASTYKGHRVYAIDGDQYDLPASKDIFENGYRGYPCKNNMETYYPVMYVVAAVDVLSQMVVDFSFSPHNDEIKAAVEFVNKFETKSITLYDRFFLSERIIEAHKGHSYFTAKCKNGSTFSEITAFYRSNKKYKKLNILGETIRLFKIKVNKETYVYATNAPKWLIDRSDIPELYALRWESEVFNRDLTETMKIEQWHSRMLNGVLQEIYVHLWIYNFTRLQIWFSIGVKNIEAISKHYRKANFKAVLKHICNNFILLLKRKFSVFIDRIESIVSRTMQNRCRFSRKNKRVRRKKNKKFSGGSLVARRIA